MKHRTLVLLVLLLSLAVAAPVVAAPTMEETAPASSGGWLPMRTAVVPAGQRFLGPFERQAVTLLVADLSAHSQITLRFDFYAIATWDGNAGEDIGPDIVSVTHSDDQLLLQTTFSNYVDQPQAYPDAYPGGSHPGQTGAAAVGSLGYGLDSVYNLSFTFAHTGATLQVKFAGVGLQGDGDEPWGLDNVAVEADGQVVYTFDAESDMTGPVVEVAQLLAADRQADDTLGKAVAVHEDLLVVGAPVEVADNLLDQNQRAGALYLFARNPGALYQWEEIQKLTPSDGAPNDRFGWTVTLDANLLVVGAPWADMGGNRDQGAVYLFARSQADPNRWEQIQKLVAPDGAADDRFGRALALNGGGMVIGAKEKAYVFYRRGDDQWYLVKTLTASDGQPEDRYGDSVALDGDIILIGASGAPIGENYLQGAAYLYQRNQGGVDNWGEIKKLTAPDGDVLTFFGHPVLLANQQAIIGGNGKQQVYIFSRNFGGVESWAEVQRLTSMAGQANYGFGARLAYHNGRLLVGGGNRGELFERVSGDVLWLPLRQLQGSAGSGADFASGFALLDNLAFVGAPSVSSPDQGWHGAVYLFDVTRPVAPTVRFVQSDYPVQESVGNAVVQVVLDRPSPYPLAIAYETSPMEQEAMPGEDYTPVSGTLSIATGATEGVINVPITNDDRLELTERLNLNLGRVAGGLLGAPNWATVTILDDDTAGACDYIAHDEESLDRAIRCLYVADPGTVTIQVTDNISLTRALPTLTSPQMTDVIIEGNGHTIDAQGHGRVLTLETIPNLTLRNVTLTGGKVGGTEAPANGGGIAFDCERDVLCNWTLINTIVRNNQAAAGGGIDYFCSAGGGGGLVVQDSVIRDNQATGVGGGLLYSTDEDSQACSVTLRNTVVEGNQATEGGGLRIVRPRVTISDSTIRNNIATERGGGIMARVGDGYIDMTVLRTLFNGNQAGVSGGGVYIASPDQWFDIKFVNSTFSGNRVENGSGGGLYLQETEGSLRIALINSTVTQNAASQGAGVQIFDRAEVTAFYTSTLRLTNSIIANNLGSDCAGEAAPGIVFTGQRVLSFGHNLDSDSSCLGAEVRQPSDMPSGNANLGPLADNGGPTLTHALLPGSQAIDAGDDAVCADVLVNGVDQRGVPRFQGAPCDLGAYEVLPPTPANTLRIQALIDGRSQLLVRGNTVQWHHFDWAAPGRHEFVKRPTVINDTLWFPVWPDQPDTENRDCNCTSDLFTAAGPLLPTDGTAIGLSLIRSRGSVQIVQFPDAGNDYTLIVEFDDSEAGSDTYSIDLTWGRTALFVSSSSSGRAGAVQFRDEDIVAYDGTTNTWQMIFDGSDLGVTKDVDAFVFLADGSLLLSFNAPTNVPGLGQVDDSDIVHFTPTALGSATAGSFALYLRGADVDLTTDGEDIDAIGFTTAGKLVVSTIGDFAVTNLTGKDEDLIRLDDQSAGAWSFLLDGSTVGLANEDVNGLWIDPVTGELYLTVKDSFAFSNVAIDSDDIFVCTPTQEGACTYGLFWDSDSHDYGAENLDSIGLGVLPASFVPGVQASATASSPADELAADDDSDDFNREELGNQLFLPFVER